MRPILILPLLILCSAVAVSAQSDLARIAEGRAAFDQHHDCPAALRAFESVSTEGRSPVWIIYMARTEECLGKIEEAVGYYEQYDQLVPNQAEVLQKIGELRYQVGKLHEQRARVEEAQAKASVARDRLPEIQKQIASLFDMAATVELPDSYRRSRNDWLTDTVSYSLPNGAGCQFQLIMTQEKQYSNKTAKENLDRTTSTISFVLGSRPPIFHLDADQPLLYIKASGPIGHVSIRRFARAWQFDKKRYDESDDNDSSSEVALILPPRLRDIAARLTEALNVLSGTCADLSAPGVRTKKAKRAPQ